MHKSNRTKTVWTAGVLNVTSKFLRSLFRVKAKLRHIDTGDIFFYFFLYFCITYTRSLSVSRDDPVDTYNTLILLVMTDLHKVTFSALLWKTEAAVCICIISYDYCWSWLSKMTAGVEWVLFSCVACNFKFHFIEWMYGWTLLHTLLSYYGATEQYTTQQEAVCLLCLCGCVRFSYV